MIPHLKFPLQLNGSSFAVVDQDSADDIVQCVEVLVGTTRGQRMELPEYGVADPTFADVIDVQDVINAVAEWEPRATVEADSSIDTVDQYLNHIRVDVSGGTP